MVKTPTEKTCAKNNMFENVERQESSCNKGVKEMFSTTTLLYDKTLPSDQKNATVFLKIDKEQYIPMPRTQFQSALTSPQGVVNFLE